MKHLVTSRTSSGTWVGNKEITPRNQPSPQNDKDPKHCFSVILFPTLSKINVPIFKQKHFPVRQAAGFLSLPQSSPTTQPNRSSPDVQRLRHFQRYAKKRGNQAITCLQKTLWCLAKLEDEDRGATHPCRGCV